MKTYYSLRAVALAGVCLAPLAAAAQEFDIGGAGSSSQATPAYEYNNEIDLGVRYQSGNSPLYGRYNGNDAKGFGSLGGFHLESTITPANGAPLAVEATGTNLNFQPDHQGPNNALAPESSLSFTAKQQGIWRLNANYDAITYNGQHFFTLYPASGATVPGLTSAVPTGLLSNSTVSSLKNAMVEETAGTRRDIGSVDGKYILGSWTVTSGFRHEHKEGTMVQTAYLVQGGTAFPQPVDYDTDRYDVQGQYATRRFQALLGYEYSKFTDNNVSFLAPTYPASTSTAATTSVYSLPGNTDAHYVTGMVGYNLTPTTRLNGNFRYGLEMAADSISEPFASMVPSSNLNFNNSVDGQLARTYDGNVSVTSRPMSALDLRASYGIDGRNLGGGSRELFGAGHPSTNTLTGATNYSFVEQNWTKQKVGLEAGYRIVPSTKVTLGYAYDAVDRSAGDGVQNAPTAYWVGHSGENTLSAKVANSSIPNVNTSISYEHAVRSGNFELLPGAGLSGAYYQAPRTADRVKGRADYAPNDEWSIGLNGKFETNSYHYPHGMDGTKRDANANIGPDVSYSPNKAVSTHVFYTYEQIYYVNQGNSSAAPIAATGWSASTTDSIHTVGLAADWKATDRLKVGFDYTFSYGDVGYNMYDGYISSNPTVAYAQNNASLSSVSSSMHSVKIHGEYKLTENISVLAGYGFDMYKDNDWAYGWNPVVSQVSSSTFSSGESQNSYRIHTVYTAMHLKF